jgi:hypothetical protein
MIRYNKSIEFDISTTTNQLTLRTDRGQQWLASAVKNTTTPWTTWAERQYESEWRKDQMDYFLKTFANTYLRLSYLNEPTLYVLYQKGGGFNQQHDMALMHIEHEGIWFFSTQNHTWIHKTKFNFFNLNIEQALGPISDKLVRQQIYAIDDAIINAITQQELTEE